MNCGPVSLQRREKVRQGRDVLSHFIFRRKVDLLFFEGAFDS